MSYRLRLARLDERGQLEELIALSARTLCAFDYSAEQIEGALTGAFGVDTELVRDGTFFVVEHGEQLAACGGWSRRATLFGGDARADRDSTLLDPRTQPARIRAFFVHPAHARAGLGRMLLDRCTREALARGFTSLELMATLTGQRLYSKCGFEPLEPIDHPLSADLSIRFVPMRKRIGAGV
jgi:GNAT superfamily N-acetyltransferase